MENKVKMHRRSMINHLCSAMSRELNAELDAPDAASSWRPIQLDRLDAPLIFPFSIYTTFHLHTHSASRHNGRKSARLAPSSLITSLHQKLRVLISMELDGVTNVQPADDYYEYFFTVSRF